MENFKKAEIPGKLKKDEKFWKDNKACGWHLDGLFVPQMFGFCTEMFIISLFLTGKNL